MATGTLTVGGGFPPAATERSTYYVQHPKVRDEGSTSTKDMLVLLTTQCRGESIILLRAYACLLLVRGLLVGSLFYN
jgi:hypothetical protein